MKSFDFQTNPARILFGQGSLSRTGEVLESLGCSRALVLTTPFQKPDGDALAGQLGSLAVGVYGNATMHTPVDVTEEVLKLVDEKQVDCTIAFGGGSTTGLGKAIAWRTDLPQVVIPTTYAGSEVTPILGQTEDGVKTTLKDPKVLPEVVIYDPELTLGLPQGMTVTSALNAMAHAVEALYAKDRNPVSSLMAGEGVRALVASLPALARNPKDLGARTEALYGAWLCGSVLGTVGMALHHKLCHTLGGTFNLPHAETHAIVLPHATAFNAPACGQLLAPLEQALGMPGGQNRNPGLGLYHYAKSIGAPLSLADLGMTEDGIERAADLAMANPYWNPRPFERADIHAIITAAWRGEPPAV